MITLEEIRKKSEVLRLDLFLIILLVLALGSTALAWSDDYGAYRYRVGFNLSNAGGAELTNFETELTAQLNASLNNGTALRATWLNPSTGAEEAIPFWRSAGMFLLDDAWSFANANGSVWVKVPSIPVGTNTSEVYLYYTSFGGWIPDKSNADNTFLFYEPCLNSSRWTNVSGGFVAGGGICYFNSGTAPYAYVANLTIPTSSVIEGTMMAWVGTNRTYIRTNSTATQGFAIQGVNSTTAPSGLYKATAWAGLSGLVYYTPSTTNGSTWYSYVWIQDSATPLLTTYRTGSNTITSSDTSYAYGGTLAISFASATPATSNTGKWTSIRVRSFASTEPTYTSAEEDSGQSGIFATNSTSCGTGWTPIASFGFKDEDTEATTNVSATITISASGAYADSDMSITNSPRLLICKPSNSANFTANITVSYSNATAGLRNYYLTATNSTSSTITAYTNLLSTASNIIFTTKNQFDKGQGDKLQHYLRYFSSTGEWTLVAMGYTDSDGKYLSSVYTNGTTFYRIYSYDGFSGTLEKTWSSEPVYCVIGQSCTYTLYSSESGGTPIDWEEYGLVSWNCVWDEVNLTTCEWADGTGDTHNFTLKTDKVNASGVYRVCESSSTSASGTLYCEINETSTVGKIFTMSFTRNSDVRVLEKLTYDFTSADFKEIGALFAFVIIIVVGFIGLTVPSVLPLMVVVGLAVSVWGGFLELHVGAIALLFFASLVIMWKQGGN